MAIEGQAAERIEALVRAAQAETRVPGAVVAVGRDGVVELVAAAGVADAAQALRAGPAVQYRIGSITKTFTAALVCKQAERGLLDLGAPLSRYWPEVSHGDLRIEDLLAHHSGLQREPAGSVWESMRFPEEVELSDSAGQASAVDHPRTFWHYSNLGFALLGALASRAGGEPWIELVRREFLGPLGMGRTLLGPEAPSAVGYSVHPYSGQLLQEPAVDCRGIAPAAQLWSTVEDLCRWGAVLAGRAPQVLSAKTALAMRTPRAMADLERWTMAFGLGLMLNRRQDRIVVGHTGSMPGFRAGLWADPKSGWTAVALVNSSTGAKPGQLAALALDIATAQSEPVEEWTPEGAVPEELNSVLGRWWSEWSEWTFAWRNGQLTATAEDDEPGTPPSIFERSGPDLYRTTTGSERGEELRVVRDGDGEAVKLYWATYPFLRRPTNFGPQPS